MENKSQGQNYPVQRYPEQPFKPIYRYNSIQPYPSTTQKIERVEREEPIITEKRLWSIHNIFLAIFLGVLAVAVELAAVFVFDVSQLNALLLGAVLITIYAVFLFFLLEPRLLREIFHKEVKVVEHPPVLKTIEKPVIKEIEKPVYKEIVRTVEKPVYKYIEKPMMKRIVVTRIKPRKKLYIKLYNYLGSSETRVYHKRNCRFSKLIKRKYRVNNDSAVWFKARKYKPCEVCIQKSVKV